MRQPWRISQILAIAAAVFLLVTPSRAYYHYVHYLTGAPFTQVPEAFDLTALPNKTVTFFVSSDGPVSYGPNDSFGSVLSQVKEAAAVWNAVPNSDLRVAFGGTETYDSRSNTNTPSCDVIFQDLPPGLLGLGTPSVSPTATAQTGQNGAFIPISRGLVMLTNTTDPNAGYGPGPSYLEEFYTTTIHELGHALGLQHTWTAAAMSQDVIRDTTRARPIDADDIAAFLELYGASGWNANSGSISGRVTISGQPWSMASVVAIPPVGPAVSALTNPDGTYTINGLVPGDYLLYAHPLPPSAIPSNGSGLALPLDPIGRTYQPNRGYFQTVFYPGTTDVTQAHTFTVAAQQAITGADFAVKARSAPAMYDLVTWSWLDPAARAWSYNGPGLFLTPAYSQASQQYVRIYAAPNDMPVTPLPLTATLLGPGTAPSQNIQINSNFILMDFANLGGLAPGPRHLALTFATAQGVDLYVLPDAVNIVNNGPPEITSLTQNADNSVTVTAAGLTPDSRVFFDGLPAAVTVPFSATGANDGAITVMPPQGESSQNATVTVFTADNQNSMLAQSAAPVAYAYPPADDPQITGINPPGLPTGFNLDGTAAMVDITTTNTNFRWGQVTVGFGSSDIVVRRVWVMGPTHLVVDVVVANNAAVGAVGVNIISGFQSISQPAAFQIQPPDSSRPTPALPVFNAQTYATVLHDADYGAIFGNNLSLAAGGTQVLLNGQPLPLIYTSPIQINFQIPASVPTGPAPLQVNNGAVSSFPIYVQIDNPPAVVGSFTDASGAVVSVFNPGDLVNVQVSNVTDAGIVNSPTHVGVTIAGVPMAVQNVSKVSDGVYQVQFAVTRSFGGWQVPLAVSVDNSPSLSVPVSAR